MGSDALSLALFKENIRERKRKKELKVVVVTTIIDSCFEPSLLSHRSRCIRKCKSATLQTLGEKVKDQKRNTKTCLEKKKKKKKKKKGGKKKKKKKKKGKKKKKKKKKKNWGKKKKKKKKKS